MEFIDQIKNDYLSKNSNAFLLHGNSGDLFVEEDEEYRLSSYLVNKLFSSRDIVLFFNPGSGIKFHNKESRDAFMRLVKGYDTLQGTGYFNQLPSNYGDIMKLLDRFIRIEGKKHSIAIIIDYAHLLFPMEELSDLSQSDISSTITLLEWTKSKDIVEKDFTVCLIGENLSDIHKLIIQSDKVSKIEVPFPDKKQRKELIESISKQYQTTLPTNTDSFVEITNGFNSEGLIRLFRANENKDIDLEYVKNYKKRLIESRTSQLVEFIETTRTLEDVAGHKEAKKRLREDADLLKNGKSNVLPMGYLIVGPIGTGKSYTAECFSGEIGIPAIKIKNFREKWVGATESNWEKILTTIKSLAPILVIVDEADAALGSREQSGDSGTQKRVFAKLAETMGDTRNRGKIIWMLLTARPELLPIDLKRQGRAEVHIPLFYPSNQTDKIEMFKSISGKVKYDISLYLKDMESYDLSQIFSGADIESVLVKAKRQSAIKNKELNNEEFRNVIESFRSSLDPIKIQEQINAAIAEVSDKDLMPESMKTLM